MSDPAPRKMNRRKFLTGTAIAAAAAAGVGVGGYWIGGRKRAPRSVGKKVIVIGIDGMDPRLCEYLMNEKDEHGRPKLSNLAKLREQGGFSPLGTSIPPQSPVAWANFINGAGPGSHGIFDFIHRDPHKQCLPVNSLSEMVPNEGLFETGFRPKLMRQGVPFWDFLDGQGVPTTFYDLPSNYPPTPSGHGHHRCLCGMGTPDMLGTYGVYQHFSESPPMDEGDPGSGKKFRITFENETADAELIGPEASMKIPFRVHRDREENAALIELQGQKILLGQGEWSRWTKFTFKLPWHNLHNLEGICRFYLQQVRDNFRLYVSPLNMDPADPALPISEPEDFVKTVSGKLGPFYTTGFQEEYSARKEKVFDDEEYRKQTKMVLDERLALFEYAVNDYSDGLLFFYFSSSDLQSHMFWWEWDRSGPTFHPSRTDRAVWDNFDHVMGLYQQLDGVIGEVMDRFGSSATIFVMSDHGFSNFARQFNLNTWLREYGYLQSPGCTSIMRDADWSVTTAYGLGINGLYLNLKGRERDGFVEPGAQAEEKLAELKERLEAEVDPLTGAKVIRTVYRADEVYRGSATALAPDLIVGYSRGYRASWATCLGDVEPDIISNNENAWSADHCADALEVPGVLFSSSKFRAESPSLVDVAPSILAEFGLQVPTSMTGKSIFT
jgi:predicted AlkP superfamily phosphohydrolase/phosphomutase